MVLDTLQFFEISWRNQCQGYEEHIRCSTIWDTDILWVVDRRWQTMFCRKGFWEYLKVLCIFDEWFLCDNQSWSSCRVWLILDYGRVLFFLHIRLRLTIGLGSRRAVCQRNGKREFMSGDSEAPFLRGYDIPLHLDDKDSDVVVNIKRKKIIGE